MLWIGIKKIFSGDLHSLGLICFNGVFYRSMKGYSNFSVACKFYQCVRNIKIKNKKIIYFF